MSAHDWRLFIAVSIFLAAFTWWSSIHKKRNHGVARFFSFESILLLCLLNAPRWSGGQPSPARTASWVFLWVSVLLALWAFAALIGMGKPKGDLENTTRLVTSGLYGVLRHPMYASLLYLGTGIWLKGVDAATSGLAVLNAASLCFTAWFEEREMLSKFGWEYRAYMGRTKRFIPFVF